VLADIGSHLGAIEGYLAQAHQPCHLTHPEHLNEQVGQSAQVPPAKITNAAMVRLLDTGQHAEGRIVPAGLLDLAGAGNSGAVGVQKQYHHHSRVVGLLSPRVLLPVDGVDPLKIQLGGQIEQEEHQVVLRQPVHW
jgi:hypothetical protein